MPLNIRIVIIKPSRQNTKDKSDISFTDIYFKGNEIVFEIFLFFLFWLKIKWKIKQ